MPWSWASWILRRDRGFLSWQALQGPESAPLLHPLTNLPIAHSQLVLDQACLESLTETLKIHMVRTVTLLTKVLKDIAVRPHQAQG